MVYHFWGKFIISVDFSSHMCSLLTFVFSSKSSSPERGRCTGRCTGRGRYLCTTNSVATASTCIPGSIACFTFVDTCRTISACIYEKKKYVMLANESITNQNTRTKTTELQTLEFEHACKCWGGIKPVLLTLCSKFVLLVVVYYLWIAWFITCNKCVTNKLYAKCIYCLFQHYETIFQHVHWSLVKSLMTCKVQND